MTEQVERCLVEGCDELPEDHYHPPLDHPRTYWLTASGPNGELFLVTDDESGINIGYAKKIGGPLTAPSRGRRWGRAS